MSLLAFKNHFIRMEKIVNKKILNLFVVLFAMTTFLAVSCQNDVAATYSVTIEESANGSVSADQTSEIAEGTTITLTVSPDDGYELESLTVTGTDGTAITVTDKTFTMPGQDVSVSATFKASASSDTDTDSTSSSTSEGSGTSSDDTDDDSTTSSSTTSDDTESETETTVTYTVTVSSPTNGSLSVDKTSAVSGATVTITTSPATNYELYALTVTGADNTAITVTNKTFTMPSQNVTISATFKLITYTVTFNANDGSASPATKPQSFTAGSAQALTTVSTLAYTKEHYDFLGWATSSTATAATYTDGQSYTATADITLYAVWEISAFYTPLTLEFIESGSITISNQWSTLKYQKNGGDLTAYSDTISVAAGDKVAFYAEESENNYDEDADYEDYMKICCTSNCYIYGNIMSLLSLESDNSWNPEFTTIEKESALSELFIENTHIRTHSEKTLYLPATTLAEDCYYEMFSGCTSLTTAPALPATTLAEDCYSNMFSECTSLTTAPDLPATTLAEDCYYEMFSGCTSLTTAPALPATTLAASCYYDMFYGCTSLTTAPDLPATSLTDGCYCGMFEDCTSLTTAPSLPATTLAASCYYDMFYGCTSLTTAPDLPATSLTDDCYFEMFYGCTSLNSITCLATDITANNCTYSWLEGVASSGTFTKASSMENWTTNEDGIPSGWTVQDYTE